MSQSEFEFTLISSYVAMSAIPITLGLALSTNKISGAVAGVIGVLILFLPCIYESVTDDGFRGGSGLVTVYPTYFVVVLAIFISSMLAMGR
jgi:hypothetical protein